MISAAAMLRCVLERRPLDEPACDPIEGGILGLPSLRLEARGEASPVVVPSGDPPAR